MATVVLDMEVLRIRTTMDHPLMVLQVTVPMAPQAGTPPSDGMRRRAGASTSYSSNGGEDFSQHRNNNYYDSNNGKDKSKMVERLDFMFPKVDREFTVQTQSGGVMTVIAYGLIAVLVLAEMVSWVSQNRMELSNTIVDTSLGKRNARQYEHYLSVVGLRGPALGCH